MAKLLIAPQGLRVQHFPLQPDGVWAASLHVTDVLTWVQPISRCSFVTCNEAMAPISLGSQNSCYLAITCK